MNSTYYHHQCYRRNAWIRGSDRIVQTSFTDSTDRPTTMTSAGVTARSVLFRVNNRFQQMMMSGQSSWRAVYGTGISDRNGDRVGGSVQTTAATSTSSSSSSRASDSQERQSNIPANNMRSYLRQWEYTEAGQARLQSRYRNEQPGHKDDGAEFTVVSYNVLAQCLLDDNRGHLYCDCSPEDLAWENRCWRLLHEFFRMNADVLCLQEIQCDHYDSFFRPELAKLGYKGLYKKRTGNKRDGCAIFFRERIFELEQWTSVEYGRQEMPALNRDNVALVAILKVRRCGKPEASGHKAAAAAAAADDDERRICVANTHLLFNPKRGDIRLAQVQMLFAEVDRLAFCGYRRSPSSKHHQQQQSHDLKTAYHPIIVCGDMNSRPQCHLYKFIVSGSLKYEGLMAAMISDPKNGLAKRGRYMYLEKELLPRQIGITDRCQFQETSMSRRRFKDQAAATATATLATASADHHDDGGDDDDDVAGDADVFSSGKITHGLRLVSAYGHRLDGNRPEVTTHHNQASCTVDYIFYSVRKKQSTVSDGRVVHQRIVEGRLSLLATYSLPCSTELVSMGGLPNAFLPSDHVYLSAKFLLK